MKDKKIRIAHIIGKYNGGGVEQVVLNYYKYIDKNKFQFDLIIDKDSKFIPSDEIKKMGANIISVSPYQNLSAYQKDLDKVFKENNYDIVHSHINTLSVFPLRIAKLNKIPIRIAHNHATTNYKELKKNLMKQILRPFSKIYATHYFGCSILAGSWLFGKKTYEKGKVTIINNAIEVDKYIFNEITRRNVRKNLQIKEDTLVIGHIGRFVNAKNHKFLINVFKEINKIKPNSLLLLIGTGPTQEKIKQQVKMLNLENNVMFLNQRADANDLYQAFDIFILPSLYEGLPLVAIEAQASSLACLISTDVTKEAHIIESTKYLSLKASAHVWATQALDLYDNYKRRNTKNDIERNHFSIEKEAKRLEEIYINLLK